MALPLLLSYHGKQCQRDYSQQDSHLTNDLFFGDMFFSKNSPDKPRADYTLEGVSPHRFSVKNTVLDNCFPKSKNNSAIFSDNTVLLLF